MAPLASVWDADRQAGIILNAQCEEAMTDFSDCIRFTMIANIRRLSARIPEGATNGSERL